MSSHGDKIGYLVFNLYVKIPQYTLVPNLNLPLDNLYILCIALYNSIHNSYLLFIFSIVHLT